MATITKSLSTEGEARRFALSVPHARSLKQLDDRVLRSGEIEVRLPQLDILDADGAPIGRVYQTAGWGWRVRYESELSAADILAAHHALRNI